MVQDVPGSAITTLESDVSVWYGSENKAQTPEGIEDGNSDGLTISLLQNSAGYHLVMIYDAPAEDGDKSKGSIDVSALCNGGACNVEHTNNGSGSNPLALSWKTCCTGGFIVGPFIEMTTVCLNHSGATGLDNGARYLDGSNKFTIANGSELASAQICVNVMFY